MRARPLLLLPVLLIGCAPNPDSIPTGQVVGTVVAGPTCPVEREPPDPACADRPIAGAVIVVRDQTGQELARAVTDGDGAFTVRLPAGADYQLVPQPVDGLPGTAPESTITLTAPGERVRVTITYDTGIR